MLILVVQLPQGETKNTSTINIEGPYVRELHGQVRKRGPFEKMLEKIFHLVPEDMDE